MYECDNKVQRGKKDGEGYILAYSALFCITTLLIFLPYARAGKSLIPHADAILQHFPALVYYGDYLRECLYAVFVEHTFSLPTWDLGIGYGSDIITTLHYYCLGDPLCLLSVFFSADNMELCYTIIVILRLYLAGVSISYYFFSRGLPKKSSLLGALLYSFSGYAVTVGVYHPFFTTPMIHFPLLLTGLDRIYQRKSPLLFVFAVAFSALSISSIFICRCYLLFYMRSWNTFATFRR